MRGHHHENHFQNQYFSNATFPRCHQREGADCEVVKFAPFLVVEGKYEREGRVMNVVGRRFRELKAREIAARSRDFH